jgi:hypothetical protein
LVGVLATADWKAVGEDKTIGIKLRGSDKQSSIWHHKEKE